MSSPSDADRAAGSAPAGASGDEPGVAGVAGVAGGSPRASVPEARGDQPDARTTAPRGGRRRDAILVAATGLFLERGYLGASMDEIATLARVSKQTLYKHFRDKESLFREVVVAAVSSVSDPVHAEVMRLRDSGELERDLLDLATRQLRSVMQPRLLELRRLAIAEANRFPELGRAFWDAGPARTMQALAEAFSTLAERGQLQTAAPATAAAQFNWLLMAEPLNRVMMLGVSAAPSPAELEAYAAAAVRAFLAVYAGV